MAQMVTLKDPSGKELRLEVATGKLFDKSGNSAGQLTPNDDVDVRALSDMAASLYYANVARQVGHPVTMRDSDGDERLITMDLGPADVHIAAAMPNYAAGYKLADGVADIACPAVSVGKQQDKYFTWDKENAFQRVQVAASAPGAAVSEVNPTLSQDNYNTAEFALGSFVPTSVTANADGSLKPFQAAMRRVMNALLLEREIRVATLLTTSGNWDSSVVTALGATAKWNGGTASDPVKNLHDQIRASYLPVTGIVMPEPVLHAFVENPNVQKYIGFKDSASPIPNAGQLSALLGLPPIHVAKMKYLSAGALTYVWGTSTVLLHQPPSNPPQDQEDIATAYTFRWNGGEVPDGGVTAGFMVRSYFDNRRTARGGQVLVVAHNDAEKMTSTFVGGLITGCTQ